MIDTVLTAIYPDATPLTVETVADLLTDRGGLDILNADGTTTQPYQYGADETAPKIQNAFVRVPYGTRLLWRRSFWPLGWFVAFAVLCFGLTGGAIHADWQRIGALDIAFVHLAPAAIATLVVWCLCYRWMNLRVTLILSLQPDEQSLALTGHPGGAAHLHLPRRREYSTDQLVDFYSSLPKNPSFHGPGFQLDFVMSGRGYGAFHRAWVQRRKTADEALTLVRSGMDEDRSAASARAYVAGDVTAVRLDRTGVMFGLFMWLLIVPVVMLGIPALILWGVEWLTGINGPQTGWALAVGGLLGFGAAITPWMFALGLAITVLQWIAGQSSGISGPGWSHRVRIRFTNGTWLTLLKTPRQAVAVEFYNLVVRDIRRPAE